MTAQGIISMCNSRTLVSRIAIVFISGVSADFNISVSDHQLLNLQLNSAPLMKYAATYRIMAWKPRRIEASIPANTKGRFVYAYLVNDGYLYGRELEVFSPFSYGQWILYVRICVFLHICGYICPYGIDDVASNVPVTVHLLFNLYTVFYRSDLLRIIKIVCFI